MMVNPNSGMRSGESVTCDFCNHQAAIFYCRADSAKLCLFCDQHVHSANALSLKHIRSQICDNCRSHPVSVLCATDNLVLCQDCDSDAHATCSVSAAHHRCPVQPFTGCPSASDLASAWGLHLEEDRKLTIPNSFYETTAVAAAPEADGGGGNSTDFMVPNQASHCEEMNVGFSKMQQTSSSSCGKQKQVILKQLWELLRRDLQIHGAGFPISNGVGIDGARVMEDAPSFTVTQSLHQQRQEGQVPFTSLLMMQSSRVDLNENDESFEGEMLWNTNPRDQGTQIWDFNLGRLRGSGPLEVGEGANDAGFTIKSYEELSREVSLENTKGLGEIYGMNCSIAHEDIVAFKNNANNPAAIQGPTYERNIPIVMESSGSGFGNSECYGGSKDIKFVEQIIMVRGECTTEVTTKADIELLAKNRGNAMLRYKEKKKTRRMVDTKKKDGKRKRILERDSVKEVKKFVVDMKGKEKDVCRKSSKNENRLVIHSDIKHSEVQLDFKLDVPVVKAKGQVLIQNIIPTQRNLKLWDLYYEECNRRFTGKVIYWCDMEVPIIIAKKLNESQLEKFRATCFGNFLEFGEHQMYSQIIHHALVREVHQRDDGEMWFLFGEKRVRFGLPEFCLISGLRWQGNDDISAYKCMQNLIIEKYFGAEVVTRSSIGRVFRKAVFDDDDEAIRMSLIFLVFNFILSTVSENFVDVAMLNFICYGDVSSFPWGKVAFEMTKYSLSNALKGHIKKGRSGGSTYNFYKDHYIKLYKLNGLPYVFQVFMFETISTFKTRGICNDEHLSDVRLCRWKELVKSPSNDKLNELVFCSGQLRVKSLIPTDDENERLDLGMFQFFSGRDAHKNVEKKSKDDNIGSDISIIKDAIDKRLRPLKKKVFEIKKDVVNLRADMKILHVQLCRDFRLIIRDELRGIKDGGVKEVDSDSDEESDSDEGGDADDADEADDSDDVVDEHAGEVGDDGLKADEVGDDGLKDDEKNDEFVNEAENEGDDVMLEDRHVVDDVKDVMDENRHVVEDVVEEVVEDVMVEARHFVEDVVEDVDVSDFVKKKDDNESEYGNEVELDGMVEEHHEIISNVVQEIVKTVKNDVDMPTFDILSQCTGKEIVVYVAAEGKKFEAESKSVLDEMVLTTQDIVQCDELEKSVDRVSGRPVREHLKSAVLRSPYTVTFGSAGLSSNASGPSQRVAVISAFPKVCMEMPSIFEGALFEQWFKIGLNNRKRTDKFPGKNDIIEPAFEFGSIPISSKMWFYKLKTPGQWLDDDHINVALYYFRKLARHSDTVHIRAMTTDCWFHAKMTSLFEEYTRKNSDKSVLSGEGDVVEYIHGLFMDVNTPWKNVDYVLFPIHMSSPDHWFLLTFDVHCRRLTVYNSLQPKRKSMQTKIMDVCEPYIFILSTLLRKVEFWRDRSDIDFSSEPYRNKEEDDIIELEFAESVPEQVEGDCGLFTICFAEHVIHQKIDEIPIPFPVAQYRKKLCTNLYMHARNKQLEGYETDREFPG